MKPTKLTFKHPEVARAFSAIGRLLAARKLQDALNLLQQINSIEPDNPNILSQIGNVQLHMGLIGRAMETFRSTIVLSPILPSGYIGMAECHLKQHDIPEAIKCLTSVPKKVSRTPDLQRMLGSVYVQIRHDDLALKCFAKVPVEVRQPPDYSALADAADRCDDVELAKRTYESLVRRGGSKTAALTSIARLHIVRGEFDEARTMLEEVLHIDPNYPFAHMYLASELPTIPKPEKQLRRAQAALSALGSAGQSQLAVPLWFALYHLLDATGDADEAFRHLSEANAIMAAAAPYRADAFEEQIETMSRKFTSASLKVTGTWGSDDRRPIFVFGLPRSGTSVVEHLLANHSRVIGVGESSATDWIPGYFDNLTEERVKTAVAIYTRAVAEGLDTDTHFVDKSLSSYLHLGAIIQMFPNAKFIHCRRHPVDVSFSMFSRMFESGSLTFSTSLETIARQIEFYDQAMNHWTGEFGGKIKQVRYEDLVTEPELTMRELLAHIGLPFERACLDTSRGQNIVRTASASQVRRPIYKTSVGKWRKYEGHLAQLIERLSSSIESYEARHA